jgi:AraC family ethanolamine operon transcriptional activator
LTLAISRPPDLDLQWRGHRVERNEILVHHAGGELDSVSQADFDMFVLSVTAEDLDSACRMAGIASLERKLASLEIVRCEQVPLQHLRRWMSSTLAACADQPLLLSEPERARAITRQANLLVVQSIAPNLEAGTRQPATRPRRLVEHAVHLARYHAHEMKSVRDLSRESGASERTLRRGFNERFGVSPKRYLQTQRLIGARRQLRIAGPETSVTDIANRWGFWHMGQFAGDYKRQFGELPSVTRRRSA